MNREDIEHMWKVASNDPNHDTNWHDSVVIRFAALVASAERERIKQANAPEIERINAHIKEALAQPEQEPVAFINVEQRKLEWAKYMTWDTPTVVNLPKIPLYTTPPQPMHPEIKKMYEDYFDKCFRESSPTQQEPVAWGVFEGNLHDMFFTEAEAVEMAQLKGTHAEVKPLYTAPQRTWVGLTDEEIWSAVDRIGTSDSDVNPYQILNNARAIEAKLKEKNVQR